jgi:hypothetical protein
MKRASKTARQLDREIAAALGRRHRHVHASRVTATPHNILVLADVAHGRREFPNKLMAWHWNHIQRDIKAGLVEIVGKRRGRQQGDRLRITPFGYESIMDLMATDPYFEDNLRAPVGEYTPEVFRSTDSELYRRVG